MGEPETGKSTWAIRRALEVGKPVGAYIIAHDPLRSLPDEDQGFRVPIRHYANVREVRDAIARERWPGIYAVDTRDGWEVAQFAKALAAASLAEGGGEAGRPVVCILDEAVGTKGARARRLSDDMEDLIARRRWYHVGIILTCQSPSFVHYSLMQLATEILVFHMEGKHYQRRLELVGNFTDEDFAKIGQLGQGEYVYKQKFGARVRDGKGGG